MLITFYGQLLFDCKGVATGIEVLARGDRGIDHASPIAYPADIFSQPEFQSHYFYALDMQIISYLNMLSSQLKEMHENIRFIFINISDSLLKELVCGGDESLPYSSLKSVAQKLQPLQLVVEISENSTIRSEHLVPIVNRLKSAGLLLAQDDYDQNRASYLSTVPWDFIKVNLEQLLGGTPSSISKHAPIVVERARKTDLVTNLGMLYQGFDFHQPECLLNLISSLIKPRATPNDDAQQNSVRKTPSVRLVSSL